MFDFTKAALAARAEPVPPGAYDLRIASAEASTSGFGHTSLAVAGTVVGGPQEGRQITDRLMLASVDEQRVGGFLRRGLQIMAQLLDAVAVGQFTPGPVLTTATFVGYLLARVPGAIVATVAIFLPSFVFVALSSPLIPRLRRSTWAGGFLDGANAASVALMALVTWQLGRAAIVDWMTAALALAASGLLLATRLNSAWLVAGGALAGGLGALFR